LGGSPPPFLFARGILMMIAPWPGEGTTAATVILPFQVSAERRVKVNATKCFPPSSPLESVVGQKWQNYSTNGPPFPISTSRSCRKRGRAHAPSSLLPFPFGLLDARGGQTEMSELDTLSLFFPPPFLLDILLEKKG